MSNRPVYEEQRTDQGGYQLEREEVGLHNEAQTIRRDRIRWGPIWAGVVTAVGTYLFLQLALIATGVVELDGDLGGIAIASGIAALIAFFLGGVTTGATAMWQDVDDGVLHGIVMWFAGVVAVIVLSAFGGGTALGAFDTDDAFDGAFDDLDTEQVNEDAREAAGGALLALTLALAAAAAGGAVGAKMWPKDDVTIDITRVRRDDS